MGKFKYLIAGALSSLAIATGANAAVIPAVIDGAAGTFSNPNVQCTPTVNSCVNGVFDSASREMIPLTAGATNLLTINGTTFGDASYSGTLSFGGATAAVPEPATWGLMLLGFGAVGFSMRRKRSASALPQMA